MTSSALPHRHNPEKDGITNTGLMRSLNPNISVFETDGNMLTALITGVHVSAQPTDAGYECAPTSTRCRRPKRYT